MPKATLPKTGLRRNLHDLRKTGYNSLDTGEKILVGKIEAVLGHPSRRHIDRAAEAKSILEDYGPLSTAAAAYITAQRETLYGHIEKSKVSGRPIQHERNVRSYLDNLVLSKKPTYEPVVQDDLAVPFNLADWKGPITFVSSENVNKFYLPFEEKSSVDQSPPFEEPSGPEVYDPSPTTDARKVPRKGLSTRASVITGLAASLGIAGVVAAAMLWSPKKVSGFGPNDVPSMTAKQQVRVHNGDLALTLYDSKNNTGQVDTRPLAPVNWSYNPANVTVVEKTTPVVSTQYRPSNSQQVKPFSWSEGKTNLAQVVQNTPLNPSTSGSDFVSAVDSFMAMCRGYNMGYETAVKDQKEKLKGLRNAAKLNVDRAIAAPAPSNPSMSSHNLLALISELTGYSTPNTQQLPFTWIGGRGFNSTPTYEPQSPPISLDSVLPDPEPVVDKPKSRIQTVEQAISAITSDVNNFDFPSRIGTLKVGKDSADPAIQEHLLPRRDNDRLTNSITELYDLATIAGSVYPFEVDSDAFEKMARNSQVPQDLISLIDPNHSADLDRLAVLGKNFAVLKASGKDPIIKIPGANGVDTYIADSDFLAQYRRRR